MTHDDIGWPPPRRDPYAVKHPGLLLGLIAFGITLGVVGTGAAVYNAQQTQAASKADVVRNRALTEQVRDLSETQAREQIQHRARNEAAHEVLCLQLERIERAVGLEPTPCPEPLSLELHDD